MTRIDFSPSLSASDVVRHRPVPLQIVLIPHLRLQRHNRAHFMTISRVVRPAELHGEDIMPILKLTYLCVF